MSAQVIQFRDYQKRPEIEVTHEMVRAGIDAYYDLGVWGWENPGAKELRSMVTGIFLAMSLENRSAKGPEKEPA